MLTIYQARNIANKMTTYYRYLKVEFISHTDIKQSNMTDQERFYKVYSPEKFKLAPREDIYLDLKFDINTPPGIEPWLNLLPSLKGIGLKLENQDWVSNKTKDNTIQLHILNRSFTYTARIKKNQCIGFIFLLGEKLNDVITTKYSTLC